MVSLAQTFLVGGGGGGGGSCIACSVQPYQYINCHIGAPIVVCMVWLIFDHNILIT